MSEYMLVDSPTLFPQECFCGSQKGPMADTGIEIAGRHVYVCTLCWTRCGRALGTLKGERHADLLKSGELLDAAKKDLAERDQMIQTQMADLAARARKIEALEELLQQSRDREQTRKHLIEMTHENTRQLLDVG